MINKAKLPKVVFIDYEIKRWDRKLIIETENHPTPKNHNRKTYVVKSRTFAKHLGLKSDRVRNVNKQKLLDQKIKGIAIMCMVTEDKVRQVLRLWFTLYLGVDYCTGYMTLKSIT